MTIQTLKNSSNEALGAAPPIDLAPAIIARIRTGDLAIAPKKNITFLRALMQSTFWASLILNLVALYYLVQAILATDTLAFAKTLLYGAGDYGNLAWSAFIESIPWLTLGLWSLALAYLGVVIKLRIDLKRKNLIIN